MYSIDDLKTFVAIADTRGVTSGARRVGISPATASHRLNKLEKALRLTLFRRNSRMLQLTDEGQIFFERSQTILADLARAERDAGSGVSELRGHLRITMSPWILTRFILPMLPAFQAKHPQLVLDFLAVDRFVALTAEGMDCAIRVGQLADSALKARKLCDNERILCAAPSFLDRVGRPETIGDALELPWVCMPWQTRFAFVDRMGRKRDATVLSQIKVSNSDTLTDAAVAGLGLTVKSRLAISRELQDGSLEEVLPGSLWSPEAPIWFVYSPEAREARKLQEFSELVTTAFSTGSEHMPTGQGQEISNPQRGS